MYNYRPIQFSSKNKYTYVKSYYNKTFSGLILYTPPGTDSQISALWNLSGQASEQCATAQTEVYEAHLHAEAFLEESVVIDHFPHLTSTPLHDPKDL